MCTSYIRDYFNTSKSARQFFLADRLPHGEINGIHAKELCVLYGFSSTRDLRLAVQSEREQGALILSSPRGYFMPSDDPEIARKEILACKNMKRAQTISILRSIKAANEALAVVDRQIAIDSTGG